MTIDFNSGVVKQKIANEAVNLCIDAALDAQIALERKREYLGASSLGHDCLRKMQWDWLYPFTPEARTERIFARGRWMETYAVEMMRAAGFRLAQNVPEIAFEQLNGKFKGHGDGLILAGPEIEGMGYSCLWENKGLGSKGWSKLAKDGLKKAYFGYYVQVQIYQAYFNLTDHPALFTATNMDTMEMLHLSIPFDAEVAQEWSDKAVVIVQATESGETLPRVTEKDDDFRCKFCSHKARCWA